MLHDADPAVIAVDRRPAADCSARDGGPRAAAGRSDLPAWRADPLRQPTVTRRMPDVHIGHHQPAEGRAAQQRRTHPRLGDIRGDVPLDALDAHDRRRSAVPQHRLHRPARPRLGRGRQHRGPPPIPRRSTSPQRLQHGDCTYFIGVPTMYHRIVDHLAGTPPSERGAVAGVRRRADAVAADRQAASAVPDSPGWPIATGCPRRPASPTSTSSRPAVRRPTSVSPCPARSTASRRRANCCFDRRRR